MGRKRKHAGPLPKGVAVVKRKGGRVDYYWYPGRNTPAAERLKSQWCKLPSDPTSPLFWSAIEHARRGPVVHEGATAKMIDDYRISPHWAKLSDRTRRDYARYLDDLRSRVGHLDPREIEPHHVAALQDQFAATPSKADHYVAVIRALYRWGIRRGFAKTNPATEIGNIATAEPYQPWPQWAWAMVPRMRRELRIACFLGLYTGQRRGDVLRMQLGHIVDGTHIRVRQGKTGKHLTIRLHADLRPIVDECRAAGRIYLVSREDGTRFTEDQFSAMWGREKRRPELAGFATAQPPIVFHGLRKSATCKLLEAGCTTREVSAVTGMSLAMVEHYSKAVDQLKLGDSAVGKMERAEDKTP